MHEYGELVNGADRGIPEYLEKKLSQCCFDQDWSGFETRPPVWQAGK